VGLAGENRRARGRRKDARANTGGGGEKCDANRDGKESLRVYLRAWLGEFFSICWRSFFPVLPKSMDVSCFSKLQKLEQLQQFVKSIRHPSNLAKQEKLTSNSLTNQLGKNRNLAKLIFPRAWVVVAIVVSRRWEDEKRNKE
jgi:hypothetical protein